MSRLKFPDKIELTDVEQARLVELELVVDEGLATFVVVGNALAEIRDQRLYRATGATFEEYVASRWDMSKSYAHHLIAATEVVAIVSPIGDIVPANEAQARELAPLRHDPETLAETWASVVDITDGKPTAAATRVAVEKKTKQTKQTKPTSEPDLDGAWHRWGAKLTTLLTEGAQLAERSGEDGVVLGGYAALYRAIYQGLQADEIDAEYRRLVETAKPD